MDERLLNWLFPLPSSPTGLDVVQSRSPLAQLWKRRRLRLEAEAREASEEAAARTPVAEAPEKPSRQESPPRPLRDGPEPQIG